MNSIFYLMRKNIKNEILDTLRHPLKFMLYAFIVVTMIYGAVMGFTANTEEIAAGELNDKRLLSGAYLAILYFISIPILRKGLSSGTSFFSLSDVNNLFVGPISERTILVYGVGRQLAAMLVLVVTFAAYGGMMINMFHIGVPQMIMLVGGIVLMLVMVQLTTLMIFCLASNHPKRAKVMRWVIYAIIFFPLVTIIYYIFTRGINKDNFFDAISMPVFDGIPLIGWLHGLVFGIMNGESVKIAVFGALMILTVALSIAALFLTKLDFYEDVLSQAESYQEFRDAIMEGKVSDKVMMGDRKVSVRKTGIDRGKGASAIFFKQLREGGRRSRFIFLNINTFVLLFAAFVIGFGMQQALPNVEKTITYLAVVVILVYIQFFFSAASDWVKELMKPYIYLIPDDAVKKLMMAAATGLIKPFTDGLITFVLLGLFIGGHPADIIFSALTYGSFGCVYIAANILAQRIVGVDSTGGVFITFYMSLILIVLLPGVGAGLLSLSLFSGELSFIAATLFTAPMFVWNIVITLVIFIACRNLLNNTQ